MDSKGLFSALFDSVEFSNGGFIAGLVALAVFFVLIGIISAFIRVALPNKVLVITGRSTQKGGRKFGFTVERGRVSVTPYLQQVGFLDLGVIPINVRVDGVNSANGITVGADATACVCINDDEEPPLYTAVERLMGKTREEIHEQIRQTLIGNFRGALNKATPLQAIGMDEEHEDDLVETGLSVNQEGKIEGDRAQFRIELLKDINSDLSSFGMKVVSVSLQKIWDTSNYIGNLAQKSLAQKRKQVEIEEARLRARAEKEESDSKRRISVAKAKADERIVAANQKLEVYRKEAEASIEKLELQADNLIMEAKNRGEKNIQQLKVELNKLKNQSEILIKENAEREAAELLAQGEEQATNITEGMRNTILQQKVKLLAEAGESGKTILFIQQQLPYLFESYKKYATNLQVDSLVIMDEKKGFNGAVNRGPAAFVDFLRYFEEGFGINLQEIMFQNKKGGDK
ncbi:MAG: hypothetical protein JXR70_16795 [Spirochaetales bacterium]|nr:hypothetical protein [Spirochaetales bacterium]